MLAVGGGLYLVGVSKPDVRRQSEHLRRDRGPEARPGCEFRLDQREARHPDVRDLYLQGRMNLDDLVSRTISLREVNDGYESLKSGSLNRVVVTSF